jgi:hypothetical protein
LTLGAWRSAVPAGILDACRLKLGACRLQLEAFFFQLSTLRNVLDGGKYGSCLIYSFINFLCLALPYLRSGRARIFFKISFCLVFAITYIFNFFIPAISTI